MVFQNNLLMGAASISSDAAYTIDYSCRFNDNDSAYMQRTFGAGNDELFSVSFWFKWGNLTDSTFLNAESGASSRWRYDTASEQLQIYSVGDSSYVYGNPVFRDPSAWYHFLLVWDLSQASGDRVKWYVNGVRITATNSTEPTSSSTYVINTAIAHEIGSREGSSIFLDGYLSQYCFIDNAAKLPTDFGEFNNGVWRPIDITGLDYTGTNSFLLDFADSSNLGNDVSGNDNDWATSGLAAADQMTDTPTKNFSTLNSIQEVWTAAVTLTDGNLHGEGTAGTTGNNITGTIAVSSGKWVFASKPAAIAGLNGDLFVCNDAGRNTKPTNTNGASDCWAFTWQNTTLITTYDQTSTTNRTASPAVAVGDYQLCALDVDNLAIWFGIYDATAGTTVWTDNSTGFTGDPTDGGTTKSGTLVTSGGNNFYMGAAFYTGRSADLDFGQGALLSDIAIPTGYKLVNTANLAEPTIKNSKKYFDTILYEGTGTGQKVGQFQPITETYSVGNSALWIEGDSTFLSRTPSSAGNRRTGSLSFWCKRGTTGAIKQLYNSGAGNDITFNASDKLTFADSSGVSYITTQTFQDVTQWNHFLFAFNTTLATAGDRLRIYHNGVEITAFDTETNPSQNDELGINNTVRQTIGANESDTEEYDGYAAEIYNIDGSQLTASSFGEVDSTTNRWIPKAFSEVAASAATIAFTESKGVGTNATDYSGSFDGMSIGAADSDRKVVVAISSTGASGGSKYVSTCTDSTSGTSFTFVCKNQHSAGTEYTTEIWQADIATGTTADIDIVFNAGMANCGVGIYRLIGAGSMYAFAETEADNTAMSLTTPAGGVAIGVTASNATSGTAHLTWGNLTETYDELVETNVFYHSGAQNATATAITEDVTADWDAPGSRVISLCVSFASQAVVYGTNGFYLDFADENDLGDDESGNGHDFAESGFDTTNGSNQFYDTPTDNFAVMGDLANSSAIPGAGRLSVTSSGGGYFPVLSTIPMYNNTGKYVWETQLDQVASEDPYGMSGVAGSGMSLTSSIGTVTAGWTGINLGEGSQYINGTSGAGVTQPAVDDILRWEYDSDTRELAMINVTSTGAGFQWPKTGIVFDENPVYAMCAPYGSSLRAIFPMNFGQQNYVFGAATTFRSDAGGYFNSTPTADYKALKTDNLTESDSFQSAFSWIKNRDAADNHMIFDRVRGIFKNIHSNASDVEATDVDTLQRFLKQGATIGEDVQVNTFNESFVYWDWFIEATGSGTSNEDGSINTTSTLVDTTSGLSISTYTGTGVAATIGHGLGAAPKMVIVKCLNDAVGAGQGHWYVYHERMATDPQTDYMLLNTTAAKVDSDTIWNDTAPTSTVFSIGTGVGVNENDNTYISYAFSEIEGYSHFGTYEGNGNTTGLGPFNYTGFQPEFVIFKNVDRAVSWMAMTSKFGPNPNKYELLPDTNGVMGSTFPAINFLSNGFRIVNTVGYYAVNWSGESYIWCAWAKNPFGGASTTPSTAV